LREIIKCISKEFANDQPNFYTGKCLCEIVLISRASEELEQVRASEEFNLFVLFYEIIFFT